MAKKFKIVTPAYYFGEMSKPEIRGVLEIMPKTSDAKLHETAELVCAQAACKIDVDEMYKYLIILRSK